VTTASLPWFARHEARLAWREWLWWLSGKKHNLVRTLIIAVLALGGLHLIAGLTVRPLVAMAEAPDRQSLLLLTAAMAMAWMLMLSQAMESVTRVLYSRGDLDLIFSSPTPARSVFVLRLIGIAAGSTLMALLLVGPFVNMLAFGGGSRWLAAYGMLLAMGSSASAIAIAATLVLFRLIGASRTRRAAQVIAAIVGGAIVIGLQVAAIMGHQGLERFAALRGGAALAMAPALDSLVWWPAKAATGSLVPLGVLLIGAMALLALAVAWASRQLASHVIVAAGTTSRPDRTRAKPVRFKAAGPAAAMRAKELTLLARDPWLMSQTLMQVLYLIPPALLLWQGFGEGTDPAPLIVPVLVMAAGQLAGGLAWLAISGEDAPDLIATVPVGPRTVMRAKIEAVLLAVALPMAPLLAATALLSPFAALIGAAGVLASAAGATAIQLFFRTTARRSAFRRRQTASRVATFSEAFSSIAWAAAAGLAASGHLLAVIPAGIALIVLGIARALAPSRG
jgi:ABC-2 type transport system permease protein